MKFGFIGAGKVGVTLGMYLTKHNKHVTGYYSKTLKSSTEAAIFTNSKAYEKMSQLVQNSDALFITVPDGMIQHVWEQLKLLPIEDKIISHFSGTLSSTTFTDIQKYNAFGYSIHPLLAIHDKYHSYKELAKAYITIEGHKKYIDDLSLMFESFGNKVVVIEREDKVRYHTAAAMVSNLYVGLVSLGENMLMDSGFSQKEAHEALTPLIHGNTENILSHGTMDALTGPIERNDIVTISNHLQALNSEEQEIYKVLSRLALNIAEEKHKNRDYKVIKRMIKE